MDNIRQQIIQQLDKPVEYFSLYYELKSCLEYTNVQQGDFTNTDSKIDMWFQGIIESLYYRPNKYVLVLEASQNIGKSSFFRSLFPDIMKKYYYEDSFLGLATEDIYSTIIMNLEFTKKYLNMPMEENFIVNDFDAYEASMTQMGYEIGGKIISSDKRLASYCSTTNKWQHPPRKNFIVLKLESINQELFNSIDKLQLWIEIFNKFKPKGK